MYSNSSQAFTTAPRIELNASKYANVARSTSTNRTLWRAVRDNFSTSSNDPKYIETQIDK